MGAIASLLATVSCFHSLSHPRRQMPRLVSRGPKIYLISSHPIEMEKRMVSLPLEQFFSCRQFSLSDGEDCVFCDCLSLSSPEVNLRSGFSAEYLIFPLVVFILNDGLQDRPLSLSAHQHISIGRRRRHFHHTLVDHCFHPPVQYQARSAR